MGDGENNPLGGRIHNWSELRDLGLDLSKWAVVDFDGTVEGTCEWRSWAVKTGSPAVTVHMTLDDGRTIRFNVFGPRGGIPYYGLDKIKDGTRLRVTFTRSRKGYHYPKLVEIPE
jgi:hypothetical protein